MEDLTKEDLFQIIQFYKSKISEQEFAYLVLQIQTNKKIKLLNDKMDSDSADHKKQLQDLQTHSLYLVEMEKEAKEKEIDLILKKYNLKKETKSKNVKKS